MAGDVRSRQRANARRQSCRCREELSICPGSHTKDTLEALHTKYPKLPIFLLGEAMGGTLALQIAASYPDLVTGTISAAPAGDHFKTKHNYFRVCRNLVTKGPNHRFDMGKELLAAATPRVTVQEAIEKDPEVRLDLTPGELMDCQFFMWKSKDIAKKITSSPVLIVQGQKDGESIPSGAKKVFDKLSTDDKQMLALNDADHYSMKTRMSTTTGSTAL